MRRSPLASLLLSLAGFVLAALTFTPVHTLAGETWKVGDKTYQNVRVTEQTPATVTIFHRNGITQLDLASLPVDLQARFGYDPEQAAAWREEATAGLAATDEVRRNLPPPAAPEEVESTAPAPGLPADVPGANDSPPILPELDLRPEYRNCGLLFKDQGRRPSCAIFGVVSALEYEVAHKTGRAEPLSEEFLIWATRQIRPGTPLDDGYHFKEVLSAIQTHGVPRLVFMPNTFGRKETDITPPEEALADARTRRNIVPIWFRTNDPKLVERMVDALNHKKPIVLGLRWPHWRTLEGNNLLRDQKPVSAAGHAVTLVGYRCPDGQPDNVVFIFRNSYGINWGLGGCGFLAASYLRANIIAGFYVTLPD